MLFITRFPIMYLNAAVHHNHFRTVMHCQDFAGLESGVTYLAVMIVAFITQINLFCQDLDICIPL
jgi:hypothetical protein